MTRKIIINGGRELEGNITLNGFKHSLAPIIASSLLTEKSITIKNVPRITDTFVLNDILCNLGVSSILKNHTLKIRAKDISPNNITNDNVSSIHGSLYLLPALLARTGKIKMSYPGGCKIGVRPIINTAFILRKFGAKVKFRNRMMEAYLEKPIATKIFLDFKYNKYYSGSTKSALILGSAANGITIIRNAYKAPDIIDLCRFLKRMGVEIEGEGTEKITINGNGNICGCKYEIMPDLIELGTFIGVAAMTQGTIAINNVSQSSLKYFDGHILSFSKMGIDFIEENKDLIISCNKKLNSAKIIAEPYPGIYSDLHPIFSSIMSISKGISIIEERVWENRFSYVKELRKMGAKISINNNKLVIGGIDRLKGCTVNANDLRAAAALVLAGLNAEGKTDINNSYHLERGYENFVGKLKQLGADITEV